jgi:heat shock protein HtpX
MIPLLPRYLFWLSWIIVGPPQLALPTIGLMAAGVLLAFVLRRSFQKRTMTLLGLFGLMFLESTLFIGLAFDFMFEKEPFHFIERSRGLVGSSFPFIIHNMSLGLSLIGAGAAVCAAIFIEFGKSRVSLSKAFPQFTFLEAPIALKVMVTRLASRAGVTVPEVCLIDSGVPSAFTVRTNRRFAVTLSVGLLESLENNEVEGCVAHEIAHLKNNDFRVRFLATLARIALFARPLSYFLEPAVYRAREFLADVTAAKLLGTPDALISAFSKLSECEQEASMPRSTCVCNLTNRRGLLRIFDKHPSLEARIRVLKDMKQE